MQFFARQSSLRRQSHVVLCVLLLALIGMAIVIHLAVALFDLVVGDTQSLLAPSLPAMVMIGIFWTTIVLGALLRYHDIRSGGAVLARRYGAVQASDRSRHPQEQELLRVVSEMAIAASTSLPEVYVLRSENTINAFVVGSLSGANTIVVTQGALEQLDRDELQAVVAHEFGHITQGDVPRNMMLIMIIGGLHAIDDVGKGLLRVPRELFWLVPVGLLLRAVGSLGVLVSRLIRATFSRRREFLADAMAVQYTRFPDALASALAVIQYQPYQEPLRVPHAEEVAHLCLHLERPARWWKQLFATHPPVEDRIRAVRPRFFADDWRAKRDARLAERTAHILQGGVSVPQQSVITPGTDLPDNVLPMVNYSDRTPRPGSAEPIDLDGATFAPTERTDSDSAVEHADAEHLGHGASDRIALLLPDDTSCLAALFALFASDDETRREKFLSATGFAYTAIFADQVRDILRLMRQEMATDQQAIIDHAAARLRTSIGRDNRMRMLQTLEKLLLVEEEHSLWHYATLQLLRRQLDSDFPLLKTIASTSGRHAEARRVKRFDDMGQEFALLLSLMVEASGAPATELDTEFQRVLACYTQARHPRRIANEPGIVAELEAAFQTLYVQPISIRKAFVQHCVEIMKKDGRVMRAEKSLLDLFAASLGCAA